ncbi:MAG: DUF5676 family membrane protein [Pseudomonadota bacterium]
MKIDARKFALSLGITTAFIWTLCSVLVFLSPSLMMTMTGHMLHTDLSTAGWEMSLGGMFFGLILWTFIATAFGWLIAVIYNQLATPES